MLETLVIAVVLLAALACPVTMWLGRRGIGPGCTMMERCAPEPQESLEELRRRERELADRIAKLES